VVGYTWSPRRQGTNPQLDELRPVGRATILE
jgi:DNA invertase Pin-like site-specific DNA recombinase